MAAPRPGVKSRSGKDPKSAENPAESAGDKRLTADIARAMQASVLPGDTPIGKERLAEASNFVFDTGRKREPGSPAIAIRSALNGHRYMSIAIVNDDMPFLVDSVAATIADQGLAIDELVHPVVTVRRSDDGKLCELPAAGAENATTESMIYIETTRIDARQRRELATALQDTLADVRAAVDDWPKMQALIEQDAARLPDSEGAALLRWLANGMLTQLGHVTRRRDGTNAALLGICRKSSRAILADATYDRAFAWFDSGAGKDPDRAPLVVKANCLSRVHRRVPLDLFIVPIIENGSVTALSVHAGIWTSAGFAASPETVPRLRKQMATLLDRLGFAPANHGGKTLIHAFAALPHDVVIGFPDDAVERIVTAMMALTDRPRPRLAIVRAPLERHLFAFVWFPRDMLSTAVRLRIQAMLEAEAGGQVLDWSLQVEGGNLVTLRFVIDIREGARSIDEAALDDQLQAMLRGWTEAVEAELAKLEEPGRAAAIAARFADTFPPAYHADHGPVEAARDIQRLRALQAAVPPSGAGRAARLYSRAGDDPDHLRLKVYQLGGSLPLSDAVPALENFGFRVLLEIPTALEEGKLATIHDFTLALPPGENAARAARPRRSDRGSDFSRPQWRC